jgi:pantoate--beta-alanine ligase
MITISDPKGMQRLADQFRREGKRIGFVPTMGYLHEGHLSLVREARNECEVVVASIFVNPTQFGPSEDLDRYPRDLDRDTELLEREGTDILFAPVKAILYAPGFSTTVRVENLTETLCGASRPWHFPGVALIVCKLFNLVVPNIAYFGQKDYQQALVIRRMTRDLDFGIEIRVCPIVRETDGLAMSSRNTYLTVEERKQAALLSGALGEANRRYLSGERRSSVLKEKMREILGRATLGKIDYVEVVDAVTLEGVETIESDAVALVAVYFSKARLIDNHVLGKPNLTP